MLLVLLILQAIAGPPAALPVRKVTVERPCPREASGDVVVCARSNDSFRLKPLPERYVPAERLPKAEVRGFGDSKLSLEAEQGHDAQGGPVNRAMVRLTIPLGGKRR